MTMKKEGGQRKKKSCFFFFSGWVGCVFFGSVFTRYILKHIHFVCFFAPPPSPNCLIVVRV